MLLLFVCAMLFIGVCAYLGYSVGQLVVARAARKTAVNSVVTTKEKVTL